MVDQNLAAACGLYCGGCEYMNRACAGCGNVKGKPFWTEKMKLNACPLYDCCVNGKKLEHCGLCGDLPCELFGSFHDPALSPEKAMQSVLKRKNDLLRRKEIGTGKWIEDIERDKY